MAQRLPPWGLMTLKARAQRLPPWGFDDSESSGSAAPTVGFDDSESSGSAAPTVGFDDSESSSSAAPTVGFDYSVDTIVRLSILSAEHAELHQTNDVSALLSPGSGEQRKVCNVHRTNVRGALEQATHTYFSCVLLFGFHR